MNTQSNNKNNDQGYRRSTRVRTTVKPFSPCARSGNLSENDSDESNTDSDCSFSSRYKNKSSGCTSLKNKGSLKSNDDDYNESSTESDPLSSSDSEDSCSDNQAETTTFNSKKNIKRKTKIAGSNAQPVRKKSRNNIIERKKKPVISDATRNKKKESSKHQRQFQKQAKEKKERGEQLNYKEKEAILKHKRASLVRSKYRKNKTAELNKLCESGNSSAIEEKKRRAMKQVEYNKRSLAKRKKEDINKAVKKALEEKGNEKPMNDESSYSDEDEQYGKTQFLSIGKHENTNMLIQSMTFESYRKHYCEGVKSFKLHDRECTCQSTSKFRDMMGTTEISGSFIFPEVKNIDNAYVALTDIRKAHNQMELEEDIVKNVIHKCHDKTLSFSVAQCILLNRANKCQNGMTCISSVEIQVMDSIIQLQQRQVLEKKKSGKKLYHDHATYLHAMDKKKIFTYYNQPKSANNNVNLDWIVNDVSKQQNLRNIRGRIEIEIGHHLKEAITGLTRHVLKTSNYILVTIFEKRVRNQRTWKVDIPGGKRKLGETPHQCVLRETEEETSIIIGGQVEPYFQIIDGCNRYYCFNAFAVLEKMT